MKWPSVVWWWLVCALVGNAQACELSATPSHLPQEIQNAWQAIRLKSYAGRDVTANWIQEERFSPLEQCVVEKVWQELPSSLVKMLASCRVPNAAVYARRFVLRVCEKRHVWVMQAAQARMQQLDDVLLAWEEKSVLADSRWFEARDLPQWRLRKDVQAGVALTAESVERVPDVLQTEMALVRVAAGSVRVEFYARPAHDAKRGERVGVRSPSGKLLRGTVLEKGVISVQ